MVDVGNRGTRSSVSDAEEIGIGWVVAEGREEDLGVEARAVVVDLTLDSPKLASVAVTM